MPAPGYTNLVVSEQSADALRQFARTLSADTGQRVTLSAALAQAVATADAGRARANIARPRRRRPPTTGTLV